MPQRMFKVIPNTVTKIQFYEKNNRLEFSYVILASSSGLIDFRAATTSRTCKRRQGSPRSLTITPLSNLSLFFDGNKVVTYASEACVALMPHHGASVSSSSRSRGICRTTSRLLCVLREHPFTPINNPRSVIACISLRLPSNE